MPPRVMLVAPGRFGRPLDGPGAEGDRGGRGPALRRPGLAGDPRPRPAPLPAHPHRQAGRGRDLKQAEINALMARLALKGLKVGRLKGGEWSVFGRSGEEKDHLEARGIAVEVVPGVTAASAAAAQFGFPLTHRGQARRRVLLTARILDGTLDTSGWAEAAAEPRRPWRSTWAGQRGAIAEGLIALGRD